MTREESLSDERSDMVMVEPDSDESYDSEEYLEKGAVDAMAIHESSNLI